MKKTILTMIFAALLLTAAGAQTGSIAGTVTDSASQAAIPVATVVLSRGMTPQDTVFTDAAGAYLFDSLSLRGGAYTVTVSMRGYVSESQTTALSNGTPADTLDFELVAPVPANGSISGTVTDDSTALALAQATVILSQNFAPLDTIITDATGAYSFTGLSAGNYRVRVSKTGYVTQAQNAALATNNSADTLDFALVAVVLPTGRISGTVTDDSTALALAQATVILSQNFAPLDTIITDATGTYSFTGLSAGNYRVSVSKTGYVSEAQNAALATNSSADTLDFALAAVVPGVGSISGLVTDDSTALALAQATVILSLNFAPVDTIITDATGAYRFTALNNGNYRVSVSRTGYVSQSQNAVVSNLAPADTVNFALVPITEANSRLVYGTVTADSATGAPIPGAVVLIRPAFGAGSYLDTTDASGRYGILVPIGGGGMQYVIKASAAGYFADSVTRGINVDSVLVNLALATDMTGPAVEVGMPGREALISCVSNPAVNGLAFRLSGNHGDAVLVLYSTGGKAVAREKIGQRASVTFACGSLGSGAYIWRLEKSGKVLACGRSIVLR